jgi:hypothetical protein
VFAKIPVEIGIEDNMWMLKQTPVDTHTFKASDGLTTILTTLVKKCNEVNGTNFTVNALTETTFGSFTIGNETACQVLDRLQKTFGFESYFRGNELRSGVIVYMPGEAVTEQFEFQRNIINGDDLEYVRKDDIVLSAIARNTITEETGKFTWDGKAKTKRKRIEVLVTIKNGKEFVKVINSGERVAGNEEGERRKFFFPGAKTINELAEAAYNKLIQYYYDGLRGNFETFGMPFVRQGDNAQIVDKILPERNGIYRIKKVDYSGGVDGLRQKIHLDFKINI